MPRNGPRYAAIASIRLAAMRSAFGRPPAVARDAMVATSQPLATRAGLRALERGGNAADAAIAAAAVQCVTEPMSTGVGGDCFAIVWHDGRAHGLDAAGPAPAAAAPSSPVAQTGPRSVTVPGAVAGWAALAERYGRLGLDACLADAIDAAERGFAVTARCAAHWQLERDRWPGELGPVPRDGRRGPHARARRDAARHRRARPSGVLRGSRSRGDRLRQLAGGRRPGVVRAALGRAAERPLPGPSSARAAAADPGGRGARDARPARAFGARPRHAQSAVRSSGWRMRSRTCATGRT